MAGRATPFPLPPELRDMIYDFYFAPTVRSSWKHPTHAVDILLQDALALCKAYPPLRREVLARFYKNHRIVALNMSDVERFYRPLALHPRPLRPLIRGCIRFPGVFEPRAGILHRRLTFFTDNVRWAEPVQEVARDNDEMESLTSQDVVVSFFKVPRLAEGTSLLLTRSRATVLTCCSLWLRVLGTDGSVVWQIEIKLEHLSEPFDIDGNRLVCLEYDDRVLWSRGVFKHCAVTFEGDIGYLTGFMRSVVR